METKANYVLIGFFTLAVLAAGFGFVHWFRSIGRTSSSASYHVIFQGPVGGLRTGATVLFNGMRVGEVSDLQLNREDPKQVIATLKVDANTPVRRDTYVGLEFQGLTGIASVALKGGDPLAGPLPEGSDGVAVLTADPNATQDLSTAAREVLHKLDAFVSDNSASLHNSLANIEAFTVVLKNNSERIDRMMTNLAGSGDNPGEAVEMIRAVHALADNLDKRVDEIAPGLARFTSQGLRQYEALAVDGRRAIATFEQAVKNFDQNPSRVIFGGGNRSSSAPAVTAPSARPVPAASNRSSTASGR